MIEALLKRPGVTASATVGEAMEKILASSPRPAPAPPAEGISEKEFQARVIELARSYGWEHIYHTFDSRRSEAGFPDLLLLRGEEIVVLELKVPPNKATAKQRAWLKAFERAHVGAHLIYPDQWQLLVEGLK
jgi:hypothetical protein